jgi:hypothetical protein
LLLPLLSVRCCAFAAAVGAILAPTAQDMSEVEDPRVDVCLFCLPPHRLRAIDIK